MEYMRHLKLGYPSLNNYPSIICSEVNFPRVSPELQALPPTSDTPLYAEVGADNRSWTLGKGWNNLATLKLAGLSQNGVRPLYICVLTIGQNARNSAPDSSCYSCSRRPYPDGLARLVDAFSGPWPANINWAVWRTRLAQTPCSRYDRDSLDCRHFTRGSRRMCSFRELCTQ